jgi:ACS family hexuronate transporter-like MFS transporter
MGGVDAEANYGNVVLVFQLAYAISLLVAGRVMDKIGTRIGYALSVTLWSLCSMSHSLAKNATHFAISRFGLGLGEAGTFPASIKTVAEWFPKRSARWRSASSIPGPTSELGGAHGGALHRV